MTLYCTVLYCTVPYCALQFTYLLCQRHATFSTEINFTRISGEGVKKNLMQKLYDIFSIFLSNFLRSEKKEIQQRIKKTQEVEQKRTDRQRDRQTE